MADILQTLSCPVIPALADILILNSLGPSDSKITIIGWKYGLSPRRRQAIISTNVGILLIGPLGTNFNEILIEKYIFIQENVFENVTRKLAVILPRPQCVNGAPKLNHQQMQFGPQIDGLVQERHNSSALAVELWLSYTSPLKCSSLKCPWH